jgi:hypothetical protein
MDVISGKTIILLTLFATDPIYKAEYGPAADTARRTIMMYPEVKKDIKTIEKRSFRLLENYTGLNKSDLAITGYALPFVLGQVTTKPFPKLKYENDYIILRPEITYNLQNEEFNGMLILIIKRSNK